MTRPGAFGFLGLLLGIAVALALRVGDLSLRPLHNDEAINAFKLRDLWERGEYRYDPHEYHGPALYYLSLPVLKAVALVRPDPLDEVGMRMVTVVFGVGLVGLLALWRDGLGRLATVGAALFTAVSPAMVFYSRYYIHEVPLVFFGFLTLTALWRYRRRPGWGWVLLAGAGVGLMYATKETFVLALAAGTGAWVLTLLLAPVERPELESTRDGRSWWATRGERFRDAVRRIRWSHVGVAAAVAVGVAAIFFSSFLTRGDGVLDAVRTYAIWLTRAGGDSPHIHGWGFYLERLAWFHASGGPYWTEGAVLLLAALGGSAGWWKRDWPEETRFIARFGGLYTVLLAAIYGAIPYKTPWCLLGFYHGALVLAGLGVSALVEGTRRGAWRFGVGLAVAVAMGHLGWQAWRSGREWAADFRNPYVYGHTSPDVANLLELVDGVVQASGEGKALAMQVMAPEANYWPLPWYWRRMERVGWWDRVPENPLAPVVVAASRLEANLEERSGGAWWMAGTFELRPRFFVEVFVERRLWDRYLAARSTLPGE